MKPFDDIVSRWQEICIFVRSGQRNDRGLSQSVEAAILIAAAVTIGLGIAAVVGVYVTTKMSGLG